MKKKVPSSITPLDLLAERKSIMLEINSLKQEREILQNEVKEYNEAKTAIQQEFVGVIDISELKDKVLNNIRTKVRKETKDLVKNNNNLQSDKQKREKEVKNKEEKLESLEKSIETKGTELENLQNELSVLIETTNQAKIDYNNTINFLNDKVSLLSSQLEKQKEINDKLNAEFSEKTKFILDESKRLSKKGQDLGIYESRLRKKCLELYPEMQIII